MTADEISELTQRIDRIVRERGTNVNITGVEIVFRPDHQGDPSVYVTVEMAPGDTPKQYARFLMETTRSLATETHTSDGFLFPYVQSRIEDVAA